MTIHVCEFSRALQDTFRLSQSFFFFFTDNRCGWILCFDSANKSLLCHFTLVKLSQSLTFTENSVLHFKHPHQQDHLSCKTSGWRFWWEGRKTSCIRSYCSCRCYQVSALGDTGGWKMYRAEGKSVTWVSVTLAVVITTCVSLDNSAFYFFFLYNIS